MIPDLPPSFQQLYQDSGPILRYRILRDVLGRDESWIETASAQAALVKEPRIQELMDGQLANGSFGDRLSQTVATTLWLCEAGVEEHPTVVKVLEYVVLPTLAQDNVTWEFPEQERRLVRDACLHVLARATRGTHPLLETYLELITLEWEHWLSTKQGPPTSAAYSAMVWWRCPAERMLSKRALLTRLLQAVEQLAVPLLPEATRLVIPDKQVYLAEPVRMLHDLDLGARAGIIGDVEHLQWLYDELEVAQDADGQWHFEQEDFPASLGWYYPLEKNARDRELTIRALMIYKLLNYDV
ncbi:MAG: hypothetical protein IPG71_04305 [bacterium]|nr:hypothetical protein [bacterium]